MKDEWLRGEIEDFKKMVIDQAVQIEILHNRVKDLENKVKELTKHTNDEIREAKGIFSPRPRFWK